MNRSATIVSRFLLCLIPVALFLGARTVTVHAGQEIVVSAASSLTNVFTNLGEQFEVEHTGVKILFNFASSGSLLHQIEMGAPVDLFASADPFTMDQAVSKELVIDGTRRDFACNSLVLITPASLPTTIRNHADLTGSNAKRIAMGNPETVPAGRYVRELFVPMGLWQGLAAKMIYGNSVRQVLDYVRRGEVDAGVVYRTDALLEGRNIRIIEQMGSSRIVRYPIAIVAGSEKSGLAASWIHYILSDTGRDILIRYGFEPPQPLDLAADIKGTKDHED